MTKMSRSPYTDHVILTNKHSGQRTHKVQAFVLHIMAAKWTGKRCAEYFRDTPSREASANYCIGYDGDVALNVEEENRAWTSSSNWADNRALTYELANSEIGHPWKVSDKTLNKAIKMLAEHHKRYGLKKCTYTGDTNGTIWRHDWFANTTCPGPFLGGLLNHIAEEVNKILRGEDKPVKPASPKPTPATPKPVTGKQVLHLPASAETWRVYKPNGPYTKGNEVHLLTPSAYGGIDYEIKGNPAKDVYLIDTGVKGRVAIYAGAETGAKITGSKAPVAKPKPKPVVSKAKRLHLPASAKLWKIYNPKGPYTSGNEIHNLTPSAYGGLTYGIKGNPAPHVYLIDTGVKGRVAIYAHPNTGATIK